MTDPIDDFDDQWLRAVVDDAKAPASIRNLTWPPQKPAPSRGMRRLVRPRLVPVFSTTATLAGTVALVAASVVGVALWHHSAPAQQNSGKGPVVSLSASPAPSQTAVAASPSASRAGATASPQSRAPAAPGAQPTLQTQPLSTINCEPKPSACGYPDATNTGVPVGTVLTPVARASLPSGVTWDPNELTLTVTKNGTTISNISIGPNGSIWVEADNVTIRDVSVSSSGYFDVVIRPGYSGTVVEDSTLYGEDNGNNSTSYAIQDEGTGTQMVRLNMYNCWACVLSDGLVQDSYIHDMASNISAADISGSGSGPLQVIHDTLLNQGSSENVVFCPTQDCTITNSLLAGGGFTIEGGSGYGPGGNSGSNIVVTNNRFSSVYFKSCGASGDVVHFDSSVPGNVWSGNVWDSDNATLPFS